MKVRRSGTVVEKAMPIIKIGIKIEALAVQGLIFDFVGGFETCLVFDEFLVGQKTTNNFNFSINWAKGVPGR